VRHESGRAVGALDDQREPLGVVVAALGPQLHPVALADHHQPAAIMLHLVQPLERMGTAVHSPSRDQISDLNDLD
jgi:hypothetical protein